MLNTKPMSWLRAACLPFVSRSFRGSRLRARLIISGVLAMLSLVLGFWFALGSGDFERGVREATNLEESQYTRQYRDFVLFADSPTELDIYESECDLLRSSGLATGSHRTYSAVDQAFIEGVETLQAAVSSSAPPSHRELQNRASALLDRLDTTDIGMNSFGWHNPQDIDRLQAIVDAQLVPNVQRYRSPLGVGEGLKLVGMVSGVALMLALLGLAPLLASVQTAQEVHENTLQPLSGVALSTRQLAIGLTSGPLVESVVIAAPQLLLFVGCAALVGSIPVAAAVIVQVLAASALLLLVAQLAAHAMGRKRAPGFVAMSLGTLLVLMFLFAAGFASDLSEDTLGALVVLPQSGGLTLLPSVFDLRAARYDGVSLIETATTLFIVAPLGFSILASAAMIAFERRLTGRTLEPLTRLEGFVTALTLTVLAFLALPEFDQADAGPVYVVSLSMLLLPLQLVVMGRVPQGETTSTLRRLNLSPVLLEYLGYIALHGAIFVIAMGGQLSHFEVPLPGLFHLTWVVLVAALLSVRSVAGPMPLAALLWAGFAVVFASLELASAINIIADASTTHAEWLPVLKASPMLAVVQVGGLIYIPVSLLRTLLRAPA